MPTKQSLLNGEHGPFRHNLLKSRWRKLSMQAEMVLVCEHTTLKPWHCYCTYGCNTCDCRFICVSCNTFFKSEKQVVPTYGRFN